MNNKALVWGGLFGLIAPFVGLFVGLQVSPMIANTLMFPIIGMSTMVGSPLGMWDPALIILGIPISVIVWALIFGAIAKILKRG